MMDLYIEVDDLALRSRDDYKGSAEAVAAVRDVCDKIKRLIRERM